MTARSRAAPRGLAKAATGIAGFDVLSRGGLPRNRTSLLMGGPGSGKTVFALQSLVNAAGDRKQSGIFVAFEEDPAQILENAATFDWCLPALAKDSLFFLNAQLSPTVVQSGDFDLGGMLAILEAKKKQLDARWIVFDGIDVLLALLPDPGAAMREIYRLRDWLAQNELTAIITTKIDRGESGAVGYGFMQFMVDCVIRFDRRLEQAVPVRRLEITKYRGSDFAAGEFPLAFGPRGLEVTAPNSAETRDEASTERVSIGFADLDTMLAGGLLRGSSTLITGAPGTSKTTLAGQFAAAACRRGERTLYVSFDEGGDRIQRNLKSVGIYLAAHVKSGLLRFYSGRTDQVNPEEHLARIGALLLDHQPQCVVIDPLSAIAKTGALSSARAVGNRLIYKLRDLNATVVITALVGGDDSHAESTPLQISTIADNWIHLSYLVLGGERNRALAIIKSRGTQHSNQVRELLLSSSGLALAEVYTSGGEVLMGTLRWEKEAEENANKLKRQHEFSRKHRELESAEADIAAQIAGLQLELQRQRAELALYTRDGAARRTSSGERKKELRRLRSADTVSALGPAPADRRAGRASAGARKNGNGGREPRRGT